MASRPTQSPLASSRPVKRSRSVCHQNRLPPAHRLALPAVRLRVPVAHPLVLQAVHRQVLVVRPLVLQAVHLRVLVVRLRAPEVSRHEHRSKAKRSTASRE